MDFKKFKDGLKGKLSNVKENVNKQNLLDLVSDVQKDVASGGNKDLITLKALEKLGQMAMGKYEGKFKQLENVYKDPSDIQMAEEIKAEFSEMMKSKINFRQFIYGSDEAIDRAGTFIVNTYKMEKDDNRGVKVREWLDSERIRYNDDILDNELKKILNNKEFKTLLSFREQVDRYVFIDRMTKEQILALPGDFAYGMAKHYKYQCDYCRRRFEDMPRTGLNADLCEFHPAGHFKGPHKVHSIE